MTDKTCCERCGKGLEEGERAVGITGGTIDYVDCEGFKMDTDEPWIAVLCRRCNSKREDIIEARDAAHIQAELLKDNETLYRLKLIIKERRDNNLHLEDGKEPTKEENALTGLLDYVLDTIEGET